MLWLLIAAWLAAQSPNGSSGPWLQYTDVRQVGFDPAALRAVCDRADALRSGALMVVYRGRVLLACGDVSRPFEAHSVRKSIVSALFGTALARGQINLDSTLADFAIDELTPLTGTERSARLRHVLAARSGVFLPAAYGASQDRRRPARGSHAPGTRWFYNNWDFNIAGVIYERATKEEFYESFERRLARPLGMEDWKRADGFRVYEPTKSLHPAHTFRISARDLARFGQLYLQNGQWGDRRILPADWVMDSTRPHTDDGHGTGYGYMWWTYQAGGAFTAKYPRLSTHTFYRGLGSGEQGVWVIPGEQLVIVHRADTDHDRNVDSVDHWQLVESILAARNGEPASNPVLRLLAPSGLRSQLPPATTPEYRALAAPVVQSYLGDYRIEGAAKLGEYLLTPDGTVRVFLFDDKPFVHLPGVGDIQAFPVDRDRFTARALPGISVRFERGAGGRVTAITLSLGHPAVRAARSGAQTVAARGGELRVFTTRAIATVLAEIRPDFERQTRRTLNITTDVAARMVRRIEAGEHFDVLVAAPLQIDALIAAQRIRPDSRADLARSGIGVAVRAGAAKPDVSTVDSFRRALTSARSIAYLKEGQSGVYIDGAIERLGLREAIQSKLTRPETDIVSELVSRGEIELGIVVITQILTTPGVELAGPLPADLQRHIIFSGGISAATADLEGARALIAALRSAEAARVMRVQGMEPGAR